MDYDFPHQVKSFVNDHIPSNLIAIFNLLLIYYLIKYHCNLIIIFALPRLLPLTLIPHLLLSRHHCYYLIFIHYQFFLNLYILLHFLEYFHIFKSGH